MQCKDGLNWAGEVRAAVMQQQEPASEAYILKSELAMRRHAVLMPAELPKAKRQKTSDSGKPCACARAHAFVSDSPLSPSRQPLQIAVSIASPYEVMHDPPDSLDASSEEEASFAVRTISELDAACSELPGLSVPPFPTTDPDLAAEAPAGPELFLDRASEAQPQINAETHSGHQEREELISEPKAELQITANLSKIRATSEETKPKLQFATVAHVQQVQAGSQQESTVGAGSSGPSNTSHKTNVAAAVRQEEADTPTSPALLSAHSSNPDDLAERPSAQPAEQQPAVTTAQRVSVAQLLASGPYKVDSELKQVQARSLEKYKAKVDAVHASGRVRKCVPLVLSTVGSSCVSPVKGQYSVQTLNASHAAIPAAQARHDRVQGVENPAQPRQGAWPHSRY